MSIGESTPQNQNLDLAPARAPPGLIPSFPSTTSTNKTCAADVWISSRYLNPFGWAICLPAMAREIERGIARNESAGPLPQRFIVIFSMPLQALDNNHREQCFSPGPKNAVGGERQEKQ